MEVIIAKDRKELAEITAGIIRDQILRKPNSVLGLATGSTPEETYARLVKYHKEEGLELLEGHHLQPRRVHRPAAVARPELLLLHARPAFQPRERERGERARAHGHGARPGRVLRAGMRTRSRRPAASTCSCWASAATATSRSTSRAARWPAARASRPSPRSTIKDNAELFFGKGKEDEVPKFAITMGVGTILEARKLLLIAFGKRKAGIVKQLIEGPVTSHGHRQRPAAAPGRHRRDRRGSRAPSWS